METVHGLLFEGALCLQCGRVVHIDVECCHGYPTTSVYILPIYHPAAGLHQPDMAAKTAFGFARLASLLTLPTSHLPAQCWTQSPVGVGLSGLPTINPWVPETQLLGLDTEGWDGEFYGFSLSNSPTTGYFNPVTPNGITALRMLAGSDSIRFMLHHAMGDLQVL